MVELDIGSQVQIAQAAAPVGEIAELSGDVLIIRATGETVEATVGTPVFQNDTFETGPGAGVGISFADDSAFSLGPDARLTIDEFVYNPGGDSGMAMNLVQGAFSFVSGQIAKTGENNMTIVTPTATIGVRGTAGAGDEDEAVLLQEPGQPLGEMTVTTPGGTVTLNSVNAYTNTSNPLAPPTPPQFRPLDQIQSQFGGAIRELPGFAPGNQSGPGDDGQGQAGQGETGATGAEAGGEAEGEQGAAGDGEEGGGPDGQEGEAGEPAGPEGEEPEEDAALGGPAGEQLGADGQTGTDGGAPQIGGLGGDGGLGGGDDGFEPGGPEGQIGGPDDVIDGQEGSLSKGDFDNGKDDFFDGITDGAKRQADGAGEGDDPAGADADLEGGGPLGGDPLGGGGDPLGGEDPLGGPQDDFNPGEEVLPGQEPDLGVILVSFNSDDGSPSHTLTDGIPDFVTLDDSVTVNVLGVAEGGDSFFGSPTIGNQIVQFQDPGAHSFTTTDIDRIEFVSSLLSSDALTIQVLGTDSVVIDGPGDFNGDVFSGIESKSINIGTSFATSTGTVVMGGANDTLNLRANSADIAVSGVENLDGSIDPQRVTVLDSLLSGANYDGQGGTDELVLTDGTTNAASIFGFETISANTVSGVTLTLENSGAFNLAFTGSGSDTANFFTGNDAITTQGVENINAGAGTDTLLIADSGAAQTVTVTGFVAAAETITGSAQDDTVLIADNGTPSINLLGGVDEVQNASGGSLTGLQLSNVDRYVGNGSVDDITSQTQFFAAATNVYDGGGGVDSLTLTAGTNILSILNFETINGSGATDTVTLEALLSGATTTVNLQGGVDNLTLADGGNDLLVVGTENVTGGTGNDTVRLNDATIINLNLGAGTDAVINTGNQGLSAVTLTNVENYTGGTSFDQVFLIDNLAAGATFDGGGGAGDNLGLNGGVNTASITDFDQINGTGIADTLTLEAAISAAFGSEIALGTGTDTLNLANGTNVLNVRDVELLNGGTGSDTVTLQNGLAASTVYDGGAGNDSLVLFSGTNVGSIVNFETIDGSAGGEQLTLENVLSGATTTIDLKGGTDTLTLANGANDLFTIDIETVNGGNLDDVVTHKFGLNSTISLGAGNDTVNNIETVTTTLALADVEQYVGSAVNETVNLNNLLVTGNNYDGGNGTDVLNLFTGANTAAISAFETINGSAGIDNLTLEGGSLAFTTTINLGAGFDTVTLSDSGNNVRLEETENINGGTGADFIRTANSGAMDFIGGAGTDAIELETVGASVEITGVEIVRGTGSSNSVTLSAAGETTTVEGIDTVFGGVGNDFVTLGDNTSINLTLSTGSDTVTNASNLNIIVSLSDVESYNGGNQNDIVTANTALLSGSIYNGAGGVNDHLILNANNNTASLIQFDLIQGTSTDDTLTLESAIQASFGTTIDLLNGADADTLNLTNLNNNLSVRNIETINGGTAVDIVNNVGVTGATFRLGGGADIATGAGTSRDDFVYLAAGDAAVSAGERITNFEVGIDKLDLQALTATTIVFNGIGLAGAASAGFVDGVSNVLQIDISGDQVADLEITLDNVTSANLQQSDLIVAA